MPYVDSLGIGSNQYDIHAKQLTEQKTIDGVGFDGSSDITHYGVCATTADAVTKVVSIANFILDAGARVSVKFMYADTTGTPLLNVNDTGAAPIMSNGTAVVGLGAWDDGEVIDFVYDGENFQMISGARASSTIAGRTMLDSTLTEAGKAADAKAVANAVAAVYPTETIQDTVIASFTDGASNIAVKDLSVAINAVQSGSGEPSTENVRPIVGWTGVRISRCATNLFDGYAESGYWYGTDGSITQNDNARISDYIPITDNETYIGSAGDITSPSSEFRWVFFDADKNFVFRTSSSTLPYSVTPSSGATYVRLNWFVSDIPDADISEISFKNSSDSDSPVGTTYAVSWMDEVGTVYGGELDVTTGLLTITHRCIAYDGTESWLYQDSTGRIQKTLPSTELAVQSSGAQCLCSHYRYATESSELTGFAISSSGGSMFIYKSGYASSEAWKAYLAEQAAGGTPLQLCYPLAEAQTAQLSPTEVDTLLGDNNIWANTGNVSVEYRADIVMYVSKMLGGQ